MPRISARSIRRALRPALALLATLVALSGCKEGPKDQLYFDDLKPPLGVGEVKIIKDENLNKPEGGEITIIATVEPEVDKDELDRLMESFLRQVKIRRGFQANGGKPGKIDMRFYTSEKAAKAGGDDWLARTLRKSANEEVEKENRQRPPLLKYAKEALGKMPEFSGDLKPQILADNNKMILEITWPFVAHDGSGKYVEELSHEKATTEFSSVLITLFNKLPTVQKITFTGKHDDETVMKIWMTRDQFDAIDLKQVEENLGAYQGQFIELLLSKKIKEKQVTKKVKKQRRKVYREALGRLPEDQVQLHEDLQ